MIKDGSIIQNMEVVNNEYLDRDYEIKISIPEFTCVCPRTGQPDFAIVTIHYIPKKYIVELKSLKLYLQQYRNVGIFHEAATIKILDHFFDVCKPKKITITGNFNARGGISTIVEASLEELFIYF